MKRQVKKWKYVVIGCDTFGRAKRFETVVRAADSNAAKMRGTAEFGNRFKWHAVTVYQAN